VADKYEFLSDEWIEAARAIWQEQGAEVTPPAQKVKLNLVTTGVPFKDGGEVHTHVDTSSGETKMDAGHVEDPDVTITAAYDIAKQFFVEGDTSTGLQAFMSGQIKVQGDMTKLMGMMQGATPDPAAGDIAERIKAITA
jgi:putative sterol carrier protein